MATGNTGPQDLGRLAEIDERQLNEGVTLWGRFCVRGERRVVGGGLCVGVEDLERRLGDGPAHRVELHLINAPAESSGRARLKRACAIESRAQPRVYATIETGDKLALICEPVVGAPFVSARLEGRNFLVLARELSELLAKLHDASVHGVRFSRDVLRVEDGHYSLDGFTHLLGESRAPERDVEALSGLLDEIGGKSVEDDLRAAPTSAREFWQHVQSLGGADRGLVQFDLPADPPFVGRLQALASLEAGLSQSEIAKPTAIVVAGERGVGKSRLLREFVAKRLQADDVLVLTGAWQSRSGDSQSGLLGALEQLSTRVLPRLGPDERDEVRRRINRATKHLGAIVARSAPALGAVLRHAEELPQLELGGDFSRHTAVIADVLKAIGTRQRPLLLVLDNVESVDANSAAVLEIITQSRPAHYTLVVMGLRTKVAGYRPGFETEHIALLPLTVEETGELLARSLPGEIEDADALAQILWSVSGGLPLALGATLRSWLVRGRLTRGVSDGIWRARRSLREEIDEEPSVRELFASRLAEAQDSIRLLALRIAVFGGELRTEDLRELDVDVDVDVDVAVRDLVERGLLTRTDTGVRFPHDTIRDLVLESFEESERRAAHRSVAQLLIDRQAPISQIVYHRDLAFDAGNETPEAFDKLSRLHVDAGRERLDVYDLERAHWHLERALEHSHDSEQRGLAAEGLADICLLQDDLDTAVSLYTAIIATAKPSDGVRVAAKAVQFLFSKSANADARQLGNMALEMAQEPTPTTPIGKLAAIFGSIVRSWFGEPKLELDLRDGLCRLYMYMTYIALIDDPASVMMYVSRGRWIAIGLEVGSAAIQRSVEATILTVMGFVNKADEIFAGCDQIAHKAKDAWAQGMVFHHWGGALLAVDRYSEGQDRLDDAIAAFRETGDVSIAMVSMFEKCLYGLDREHADVVLGWAEEALTTARRNGIRSGVPPIQSLKLHVLARQGRTDLDERLVAQAQVLETDEMPGIERLASRIYLAYACLESGNLELAMEQIRAAQKDASEARIMPEFCQEVHLVTALVLLARPNSTRAKTKKMLRQAVRKFRRAIKQAPRLRVLGDLLEFTLALDSGKNARAQIYASKIVSNIAAHENLYATRQAHRALARLFKGDQVLAAAEHEKLARNLGRRLGYSDHVLLSDFSEIGREVGVLALAEESEVNLEQSQHEFPAAGMLTSAVNAEPKRAVKNAPMDDQSDVLEAWALTANSPPHASLGSIIAPVRAAVSNSIGERRLEISCPDPELEVPVESADLQILLINMLLACRDTVGPNIKVSAWLEATTVEATTDLGQARAVASGRYLSIRVSAHGSGTQAPVIGAFSTCENLVQVMGGFLNASTDRGKVTLHAQILLDVTPSEDNVGLHARVIVVHSDTSIRETIVTALDELGISWEVLAPEEVASGKLEPESVVLADGSALDDLRILLPLLEARLVEVIKRGTEPLAHDLETLRVPFALSELKDCIRSPWKDAGNRG